MSDQDTPSTNADKLAQLIASVLARAGRELAPELQRHRIAANTELLDQLELETAPLMGEMLSTYQDREHLPDHFAHLFDLMSGPEHAWDWLIQIMGVFGAIVSFFGQAGQVEIRKLINELNADYAFVPLSPADCADAIMRDILPYDAALGYAKSSGIGEAQLNTMVELTGEPPGPMDMLSLWRRGIITKDQLEEAIRFSRIKNKYIPMIEALAHSYVSPAEVIEFAIKGLVSTEVAKDMYSIAGGLPDQFEMVYQAAGNSIGSVEAMNLWNHGKIDEHQVDEVLGRSRINPLFYPIAKLQRHKWLQVHQIETMLKGGTVDKAEAIRWLLEDGYPEDQVRAFVDGVHTTGTAKPKADTEAQLLLEYRQGVLDRAEATAALEQIGYAQSVATSLLDLADAQLEHHQLQRSVERVRAAYLAGHITRLAASSDLDKLHVPAKARDTWLTEWDIDRSTELKSFTSAQVGSFAKTGIITWEDAIGRWVAMGYSQVDAQILAAHYGDPQLTARPLPVG